MGRRCTAAVAVALLLSGAAGCARSATPGATAPASTTLAEVYAVPATTPTADGTLYLRTPGPGGPADRLLAEGTDAVVVAPSTVDGSATGHLRWYSSASAATTLARPGVAGSALGLTTVADPTAPLASLDTGDTRYVQVGNEVVRTRAGTVENRYPLPDLAPDPRAGTLPRGYKGLYSGTGPGTVSALVPSAGAGVLAFRSTGRAAAVTDLGSGRTVPLTGYGSLGAAARTSTGQVVVLAWRALDLAFAVRALVLDGRTLAVLAELDTGLAATGRLRDQVLVGSDHDAVICVAHGGDTGPVLLSLWYLDGSALLVGAALPADSGLEVAVSNPGHLYVYGGPARNTVGELDLASGTLARDLPELRAPTGSYVIGFLPA